MMVPVHTTASAVEVSRMITPTALTPMFRISIILAVSLIEIGMASARPSCVRAVVVVRAGQDPTWGLPEPGQ